MEKVSDLIRRIFVQVLREWAAPLSIPRASRFFTKELEIYSVHAPAGDVDLSSLHVKIMRKGIVLLILHQINITIFILQSNTEASARMIDRDQLKDLD